MLNLLLVSQPRSGTHFLGNILQNHSQIIFHNHEKFLTKLTNDTSTKVINKINANFKFSRCFKPWPISYYGTLVMISDYFKNNLFDLCSAPTIVLLRRNLTEQFLSLKIARQTNTWEYAASKAKIKFDQNEFDSYVLEIINERDKFLSFLNNKQIKHIVVYYEDLLKNKNEFIRISKFLKLKPFKNFKTKYKKQENRSIDEIIY